MFNNTMSRRGASYSTRTGSDMMRVGGGVVLVGGFAGGMVLLVSKSCEDN